MVGRFNTILWTEQDYADLRQYLQMAVDEKYRIFHQKLVPNIDNIMGVRTPKLQKLAKEIVYGNWREYLFYATTDTHEELVLQVLVISRLKIGRDVDLSQMFGLISDFVPKLNSWASCDMFCAGLKFAHKYPSEVYDFLQSYLNSKKEFELRFAVVMLMDYFIDDQYINELLNVFETINHDGYYVKMAVAWALSMCYVKQKERTLLFFNNNALDDFTYNKALQKTIESQRVSVEEKAVLRTMKRKKY